MVPSKAGHPSGLLRCTRLFEHIPPLPAEPASGPVILKSGEPERKRPEQGRMRFMTNTFCNIQRNIRP